MKDSKFKFVNINPDLLKADWLDNGKYSPESTDLILKHSIPEIHDDGGKRYLPFEGSVRINDPQIFSIKNSFDRFGEQLTIRIDGVLRGFSSFSQLGYSETDSSKNDRSDFTLEVQSASYENEYCLFQYENKKILTLYSSIEKVRFIRDLYKSEGTIENLELLLKVELLSGFYIEYETKTDEIKLNDLRHISEISRNFEELSMFKHSYPVQLNLSVYTNSNEIVDKYKSYVSKNLFHIAPRDIPYVFLTKDLVNFYWRGFHIFAVYSFMVIVTLKIFRII